MSTVYQFGTEGVQEYTNTRVGENDYFIRLDWNQRTSDWRISIQNIETEEWLCATRRLSPGASVALFPDGQMFCEGPEEYTLEDLGDSLRVRFFTFAELNKYFELTNFYVDPTPRIL